jgi:outer membrane protein assembly factor BamB
LLTADRLITMRQVRVANPTYRFDTGGLRDTGGRIVEDWKQRLEREVGTVAVRDDAVYVGSRDSRTSDDGWVVALSARDGTER